MENSNVANVPSQDTFQVALTKAFKGTPVINGAHCTFSYQWDFSKNMGSAVLNSINDCELNIELHPLGISGYLDFMSDIPPTSYVINGQMVVISRVILDINLQNGQRSAAIMFNADGSCIEATDNFQTENASLIK